MAIALTSKPETIRFAKDHDILVPPHATHECQPLDCSFFCPLKVHWHDVCHSFHQKHPTAAISKLNFNHLFKEAWLWAITPQVLTNGFRKMGVYSLNPACISISKARVLLSQEALMMGKMVTLLVMIVVIVSSINTHSACGDGSDVSSSGDASVNDDSNTDQSGDSLALGDSEDANLPDISNLTYSGDSLDTSSKFCFLPLVMIF